MVEWYRQRKTPYSSRRALWQSFQQSSGSKQEEWANGIINLALGTVFVLTGKGFLAYRKILRHGADGFTSPLKEGVLRIFIALKNPSPRPGLGLRTLRLIARTLTITPPRRQPPKYESLGRNVRLWGVDLHGLMQNIAPVRRMAFVPLYNINLFFVHNPCWAGCPFWRAHRVSGLCSDRLWGPPSLQSSGYRGSFPGVKVRSGRDSDHSSPPSAKMKNE
jgi:hypothetical protein